MKNISLFSIICFFCVESHGQGGKKVLNTPPPPINNLIELYKSQSLPKIFNYLKVNKFELTNKKDKKSRVVFDTYYFRKGDLTLWVSTKQNKYYDLSYYPSNSNTVIGVIGNLLELKYSLNYSKTNENKELKSDYNVYNKDGIYVEVDSFYDKTRMNAYYSILISNNSNW